MQAFVRRTACAVAMPTRTMGVRFAAAAASNVPAMPQPAHPEYIYRKTTTGLVGINVDPNVRETLMECSHKVLKSVQVRTGCGGRSPHFISYGEFINYICVVENSRMPVPHEC
jgi:hypothetical protein